ncbi:hypothetical protein B0H13DRAFT_1877748 [Mycena leptocephala]|nr:hypothetical protein B0H13DRAFT_1877748 [Mycena leptocephala]
MVTKQIVLLTTIDLGWSLASFWYANQGVGPPTPSAFNFEQRMCLEKFKPNLEGGQKSTAQGILCEKKGFGSRVASEWQNNAGTLRAAVKAKRRKSDVLRRSNLTTAELTASKALTEMLEKKAGAAPVMSDETTIDREIEYLVEQVEVERSESESSESEKEEDYDGGSAINSDVTPVSALQIRAQALKYQRRMRILRNLRLPTPTPNSPSPEPEGRMPSLYEKLWLTVEKRQRGSR